ncbi:MAG: hypothetical protein DI539_18755 [Flavobacterium psychrophilum]|jgi:hypothetical protein|nr:MULTISPECIES: hypothetical protein [Elizabethkingia]MCL1637914.1 hypothetical protein [Elizabethkingia bruuniana]PZR14713.1 MAG: hypothetical protein DI539_18755 [Flavobacterium psychrophilum]
MNKTFFFGNGLNYLSKCALGWEELLIELMREEKFEMKFLPNLLTYERIRLNWNSDNGELKNIIAQRLRNQPSNEFYKNILQINFDNYVTTNYDYALLNSHLELDLENSVNNNSTEQLYSIRRNTSLLNNRMETIGKIWNIHGELDFPRSIMLGMNHYCGSVGKIDRYLKGTYDFNHKESHSPILTIEEKLKTKKFDNYSWVELFFSSNVHIAGFGLDFSEIDLWWILTRRARLKSLSKVENKIYYYTKPLNQVTREIELEKRKRETLKALDVDIIEIGILNKDYKSQWEEFIKIMNSSN